MADTEQVEEIYEHEMEKNSSPVLTDFLRMIGGTDSMSYKVLVSDIAKAIVEQYKGSSLAGSAQSIKTAIDSLNSKRQSYVLEPNSELTITTGLPQAYIVSVDGSGSALLSMALGVGYGASSIRHAIFRLSKDTMGNKITLTACETAFGLVIKNEYISKATVQILSII